MKIINNKNNNIYRYIKVGEKVKYKNKLLMVINLLNCNSCFFHHKKECVDLNCSDVGREDNTNVIFKEI